MIAIFGGAFDPPHAGHVALVEAAKAALGVDRVLVVVAAHPGHKRVETPPETRLALARAAFPDEDVVLDDHARTVDLLRDRPEWRDPVLLLGADEFCDFPTWKEPDEVLRRAWLAVATRPGYPRDLLDAALARLATPERVRFFELRPNPAASRDVRARLERGEDVGDVIPPAVLGIVEREGLYRGRGYTHPT